MGRDSKVWEHHDVLVHICNCFFNEWIINLSYLSLKTSVRFFEKIYVLINKLAEYSSCLNICFSVSISWWLIS